MSLLNERKKFGQCIIRDKNGKGIYARTENQAKLANLIDDNQIIVITGPAGTGKSFLPIMKFIRYIDEEFSPYEKIILIRPAVTSGEDFGFLPGSLDEKIQPFLKPIYNLIEMVKPRNIKVSKQIKANTDRTSKSVKKAPQPTTENYLEENPWFKKIEYQTIAHIRGLTLGGSISSDPNDPANGVLVLVDEAQNITKEQMKAILTRIGENCKIVFCGDVRQIDLKKKKDSGLLDLIENFGDIHGIGHIEFGTDDIVRSKMVKKIILRYEEIERDK